MKKIPPLTEERSRSLTHCEAGPVLRMKVDSSQSQDGPRIGQQKEALAFIGNDVNVSMGRDCRLKLCFFGIMWEIDVICTRKGGK